MSEDVKGEGLKREAETAAQAEVNGEDQQAADEEYQTEEAQGGTEDTRESPGAPEEGAGKEEKKGFFKKEKGPRDEKMKEFTGQVRRQMAEFENFRRRTEEEESTMYEMGARDIIERIFPVIDNFERGLATIPEEKKGGPLAEGMERIYRQFRKTLEEAGVKAIEAAGQEFDPNFHSAVMHVDDENLGENVVAEELQKSYLCRGGAVRYSMIKVAG